jgi:hypothetical protein
MSFLFGGRSTCVMGHSLMVVAFTVSGGLVISGCIIESVAANM